MKLALSLFGNQKEAEKAVDKLEKSGVDPDNVELVTKDIIDSRRSMRAVPGVADTTTTRTAGVAGAGTGPVPAGGFVVDDNVRSFLSQKGVEGAEFEFYARGLQNAGALVTVKPTGDHSLEDIEKKLAEAGGKTMEESV